MFRIALKTFATRSRPSALVAGAAMLVFRSRAHPPKRADLPTSPLDEGAPSKAGQRGRGVRRWLFGESRAC